MLSEKDRQEIRRTAKRHRSAPKIVNAASIPQRDTDDAYGNPFLGLAANRLKYRDLTNDELATNAVDGRTAAPQFLDVTHFPILSGERRLPFGVKAALGDVLGTLDVSNLGGGGAGHVIDKDLIPGIGTLNGTLSYSALSDKPDLSRFLTAKDIENRATHHWVANWAKKNLKSSAFKKG